MSVDSNDSRTIPMTVQWIFTRLLNVYMRYEHGRDSSRSTSLIDDRNRSSSLWTDSLIRLDRALSGSLLRLWYSFIDIALLSLGLYYGSKTCKANNSLIIISICIAIAGVIALMSVLVLLAKNRALCRMSLDDTTHQNYNWQQSAVRNLIRLIKFAGVCVATVFIFTTDSTIENNCEVIRFYLSIVCFKTWILLFIWPPKPSLPRRRPIFIECLLLLLSLIYNGTYIGIVIFPAVRANNSECSYNDMEDLYYRAPLRSFAFVGVTLASCTILHSTFDAIINQMFYRLPNLRKFCVYLSSIQYAISYAITICVIYYYSIGSILLFPRRSGGSCSTVAPNLYRVLFIWELIHIFFSLILWPIGFALCCLGIAIGGCLVYCCRPSIVVPIIQMFGERLFASSDRNSRNSAGIPTNDEALPMVTFGQITNQFNQTQCAICQNDYEAEETVRRLPCGHIFHVPCVSHWLTITHICPVCRQRIPSTNV